MAPAVSQKIVAKTTIVAATIAKSLYLVDMGKPPDQCLIEPRRIFRGFLLGLSGLLAAWVLYLITIGKLRWSAAERKLPEDVNTMADPAGASERRARDRARGNLAPQAEELARHFFDELSIPLNDVSSPPIVTGTSSFARRNWTRRVQSVWAVANGDERTQWCTAQRLQKLAREIEVLQTALSAGEFQIQAAGVPA